MDQRKVNVLAIEYCDNIKWKNKPIILSHRPREDVKIIFFFCLPYGGRGGKIFPLHVSWLDVEVANVCGLGNSSKLVVFVWDYGSMLVWGRIVHIHFLILICLKIKKKMFFFHPENIRKFLKMGLD